MELYVDENDASTIINLAGLFNIEAKIVGRCEAASQKKLTILSEYGKFEYWTVRDSRYIIHNS